MRRDAKRMHAASTRRKMTMMIREHLFTIREVDLWNRHLPPSRSVFGSQTHLLNIHRVLGGPVVTRRSTQYKKKTIGSEKKGQISICDAKLTGNIINIYIM